MTRTNFPPVALTILLALAGCADADRRSGSDDGGTDADTDTDVDGDGGYGGSDSGYSGWTDGDTDAGTDGDTDGGWDTDTDTDTDTDDAGEDTGEDDPDTSDCEEDGPVSLWISPDDSNSMAAPVMLRAAALDGWGWVDQVPVRTWEILNYYDFDYPAAPEGELSVYAAMAPAAEPGTWRLQVGVSSPALAKRDRPPMNLALSIDTSGSMGGRPISLAQAVAEDIAHNLRSGDIISLVTWNTDSRVILDRRRVDGPDDPVLLSAIDRLVSGGSTDLHGGLSKAYELAQDNFDPGRTNRVLLISDGGANAGTTDIDLISAHAGAEGEDGIYMVGVGVSDEGGYNDQLMDSVTDAGRGANVFVHKASESARVFDERFVNTMEVAARDVRINLELPPGFEIVRFSGEEYSEDPREVEPQNIAPNDAMVIHQTITSTCEGEVDLDAPVTVRVTWKDAVTWESGAATVETSLRELLAEDQALLEKGAAMLAWADFLRGSDAESREAFLTALAAAEASNPGDADLAEVRAIFTAL